MVFFVVFFLPIGGWTISHRSHLLGEPQKQPFFLNPESSIPRATVPTTQTNIPLRTVQWMGFSNQPWVDVGHLKGGWLAMSGWQVDWEKTPLNSLYEVLFVAYIIPIRYISSKIEWDRIPTDPELRKLRGYRAMIEKSSGFFRGSVRPPRVRWVGDFLDNE